LVTRIGLAGAKPANIYFKEWREWKGLTQQQLADLMETTKQTVSRVENGQRDWGKGYLEGFAWAIGCEPSDPITRPPNQASADQLLRNASPEQRRAALAVIEAMLKTGTD
jgi:transcriptional regulator with XRE-family HTH domain